MAGPIRCGKKKLRIFECRFGCKTWTCFGALRGKDGVETAIFDPGELTGSDPVCLEEVCDGDFAEIGVGWRVTLGSILSEPVWQTNGLAGLLPIS